MLFFGFFVLLLSLATSEESIRRRDASARRASRRVARANARVYGGERASQVEPVPARQLRDERVAPIVVVGIYVGIYAVVRPILGPVAFVLPVARADPPQAHRTHRAVVVVLSPDPPTSVLALARARPNPSPRDGARPQRILERLRA